MQIEGKDFGQVLTLPDTWQRKALNLLRQGDDLVLHAPTGAGKTYVFELLVESAWKGRAVYTVPTRALANDKFREWQERGWDVGLVTGDLRHKTDASIVVATLETQRAQYLPEICLIYWSLTNTSYLLMRDGDPGMKSLWLCCPPQSPFFS